MNQKVTTIIDADLCTGCGLCIEVCPSDTISLQDGKAIVSGKQSLGCGHCAAVCPTQAVRVETNEEKLSFATFQENNRWLPHGRSDIAELTRLIASRRSCRNYTDTPVERDKLEDLVKIGTLAPSGTNSQKWTFTVLGDRRQVSAAGDIVGSYFEKLNKLAENPLARLYSRLFGKNALGNYYRSYYHTTKKSLKEWEENNNDKLFHGATAAIIVGSAPGASCPMEDAMLATQNILLAAHAMGLGSCLIGFAVKAIENDPSVKKRLQVPEEEHIYSVISLGYPKEKYQRTSGREKVIPRYASPY